MTWFDRHRISTGFAFFVTLAFIAGFMVGRA